MERRACVAASDLPDYEDPDNDPATGGCTNPTFAYCMTMSSDGTGRARWSDGPARAATIPASMAPASSPSRSTLRLPPVGPAQLRVLRASSSDSPRRCSFERDSTLRDDRHRPRAGSRTMTRRRSSTAWPRGRSGHGRVRPGRPAVLPAAVRDRRGGSLHLLLREPESCDPRGRPLRDRQWGQHARVPVRPAGARHVGLRRHLATTSSHVSVSPPSACPPPASRSTGAGGTRPATSRPTAMVTTHAVPP